MRLPAFVLLILTALPIIGQAQSIIGTWQVMKERNCLGRELEEPTKTEEELTERMTSLSGQIPKVITFNPDQSGKQNWKSVGKKKSAVREKFLYKVADDTLYFLDKKSRLIIDTYLIQALSADILILVNKSRSCERLELARVNQP